MSQPDYAGQTMSQTDFLAALEKQPSLSSYTDDRFQSAVPWFKMSPPADATTKPFKVDFLPIGADQSPFLKVYQHRFPDSTTLCPKMFGQHCPICNYLAMNRNISPVLWKALHPQERVLFQLVEVDGTNPANPAGSQVKLYDVSAATKGTQNGFWQQLLAAVHSTDPDDAYKRHFVDWANGSTLKLNVIRSMFNGNAFSQVSSIEFKRRSYKYDPIVWAPYLLPLHDLFKTPSTAMLEQQLKCTIDALYTPTTAHSQMYSPYPTGAPGNSGNSGNPAGFYAAGQPTDADTVF